MFDLGQSAKSPGEIGERTILGCVSAVSSDLMPLALASLRASHLAVQVSMGEGLSEALAKRVRRRELDTVIITELPDPELKLLLITEEAMIVMVSMAIADLPASGVDQVHQQSVI